MNIIYLRSNPINPDPRVEKEAYSLIKHGHQITILCWDRSGLLPLRSKLNVFGEVVTICRWSRKSTFGGGIKNIIKLLSFQIFLTRNLYSMRKQFDVVHAADFDTVLPGLIMKLFFRKKLVYDIFDFYIDSFPVPQVLKPIVKFADFFAIRMSDALILTNETRETQIKGSRPNKKYFIHNTPIEFKRDSTFKVTSQAIIKIVYVGILQPGRLLLEIIEVFTRHPDWELVIAGFGILENEIKEFSLNYSNIKFFGQVDYVRSLDLSSSADVLFATYDPAIPNHKYSSPNKLYEAMMLSKPIIVCKNTGLDDLMQLNNIGLSIEYNAQSFENAIEYFIENQNLINVMSLNSRRLYETDYSWNVMENRLINLYDNI